jgi:hypothetical protein
VREIGLSEVELRRALIRRVHRLAGIEDDLGFNPRQMGREDVTYDARKHGH